MTLTISTLFANLNSIAISSRILVEYFYSKGEINGHSYVSYNHHLNIWIIYGCCYLALFQKSKYYQTFFSSLAIIQCNNPAFYLLIIPLCREAKKHCLSCNQCT